MPRERERERRRAGSARRDSEHRVGGEWTTISIPDGIDVFQPKEGTIKVDVVPYEVGEGNPFASPGEWYYERTFWVHGGVGPNSESYVCPAKTADRPCPICKHRAALVKRGSDDDQEEIKSLRPKERQLWLLSPVEDGERRVVLWETSFHTFGKLLDKRRSDADDDEDHIVEFDDYKAGATLKLSFSSEDIGAGRPWLKVYNIDFKPRVSGLPEELLEHGICLDKLIKLLPYEELQRVFEGIEEAPDSSPPKKTPGATASRSDDDWDDEPAPPKPAAELPKPKTAAEVGITKGSTVRCRKFGLCEVLKISPDGTSLTLLDQDDETHKAVGLDEVCLEGAESKAPPPKPAPKPADDGDDWDEPAPPPKKQQPAKTPQLKPAAAAKDDNGWGWD